MEQAGTNKEGRKTFSVGVEEANIVSRLKEQLQQLLRTCFGAKLERGAAAGCPDLLTGSNAAGLGICLTW